MLSQLRRDSKRHDERGRLSTLFTTDPIKLACPPAYCQALEASDDLGSYLERLDQRRCFGIFELDCRGAIDR